MKKEVIFFLFILSLGLVSATSVSDDLHLNIQTVDASGNIITGTFNFVFNVTNSSNCSDVSSVIYSNSTSLTTDSRGIISYYLPDVNLSYEEQYWLCYYRDGSLKSTFRMSRVPYSFRAKNTTLSGVEVDKNLDMGSYNITTLGSIGIGTTSPRAKFDIMGGSFSNPIYSQGHVFDFDSATGINPNRYFKYTSQNTAAYAGLLTIQGHTTSDDSVDPNSIISLQPSGGNVGIGTTDPSAKLEVNGTVLSTRSDSPSFLAKSQFPNIAFHSLDTGATKRLWLGTDFNVVDRLLWQRRAQDNTWEADLMSLDITNGRLGIGTANPTQKLDVAGAIQLSDNSGSDEAGTIRWTGTEFQAYNGTAWNTFGTTGGGASIWSQSGSDIYYNNGLVGIGTTSPQTPLHVYGISSTGAGIRLESSSTAGQQYGFIGSTDAMHMTENLYWNGTGWRSIEANHSTSIIQTSGIGGYIFRLATNSTPITSANQTSSFNFPFSVTNDGNVGIGTSSPDELLHIQKSGIVNAKVESTDNYSTVILDAGNTGGVAWALMSGYPNAGDFNIRETGVGNYLTIKKTTGNVGIGTTSPQNSLNVIGDINATGLIYGDGSQLTGISFTESDPLWTANQSLYVRRNTWTDINNYPSACSAGYYVTGIGDTLTCTADPLDTIAEWQSLCTDCVGNSDLAANSVDLTSDALSSAYAGAGLTGGGTSALAVGGGTCITSNADDVAVTANCIGNTQLAYDTGQSLTTSSSPTFAGLTVTDSCMWHYIDNPPTGWLASKTSGWTADKFCTPNEGDTPVFEIDFSSAVPTGTKAVRVLLYQTGTINNIYWRKAGDTNIANTPHASGEYSHTIFGGHDDRAQAVIWLSASYKAQFSTVTTSQGMYVAYPMEYCK